MTQPASPRTAAPAATLIRRRHALASAAALGATLAAAQAAAGHSSAQKGNAPAVLPGTHVVDMRSRAGLAYRIFVAEPPGAAPAAGRPVLLFPDGNAYFGSAASLARLPPMPGGKGDAPLVVGIGYPGDAPLDIQRRTFDLVPATTGLGDDQDTRLGARPGGADDFLAFLLDELVPALTARHAVDMRRLSLAGHSLGGLFALHALVKRPRAFRAIAAISPAIWVNEAALGRGVDALAAAPAPEEAGRLPAQLLLAVARDELPSHPERSAIMRTTARAMHQRLQALLPHGLQARLVELPDENHMTTFFCMLPAIGRIAGG